MAFSLRPLAGIGRSLQIEQRSSAGARAAR